MAFNGNTSGERPVEVSEKLRQAHPWFEEGIQRIKDKALQAKKNDFALAGRRLTAEEAVKLADELEEIQRKLNPLETRHEEISKQLLAHWAHTGIEEIQGKLGNTLFHASFTVSVAPKILRREDISDGWFTAMSERRLVAGKVLAHAQKIGQELTSMLFRATHASASVSITPPSSRRTKSGKPKGK